MTTRSPLMTTQDIQEPVKVFVISDLHVGDGGPRDDWVQYPEQFDKLFAFCQEAADQPGAKVIVLGDLFNGEYGSRRCLNGPSLARVMGVLRPLNPTYCVGNHDRKAWKYEDHPIFEGFTMADTVNIYGTLFCHGHQVDLFNGAWGRMGRLASWAAGLIGKLSPELEDRLRASGGRRSNHLAFARWMVKFAQAHGCSRVVCGHSHEPQTAGPVYANAGLFARDGWLMLTCSPDI